MDEDVEILRPFIARAHDLSLSNIGEKVLLRDFLLPLCRLVCGDRGLGNDAGISAVPHGHDMVVTTDRVPTDLLAEQFGLVTPSDLGAYLVRVNVSDLAAMGSIPLAMVLTCAFPPDTSLMYVLQVMYGAYRESVAFGCPVIGGDTKASSERSLSATAIGTVPHGRGVGRGPIKPGMKVFLSGPVGHAGAALRWFALARTHQAKLEEMPNVPADLSFRLANYIVRPNPRTDLAPILRSAQVPASIDITDGLVQSITELAEYSNTRIVLDEQKLRYTSDAILVSNLIGISPLQLAQGVGLDLELVVVAHTNPAASEFYEVGRVTSGPSGVFLQDDRTPLPSRGFDHFARNPIEYASDF